MMVGPIGSLRSRLRFSLRTFLLLVGACCVLLLAGPSVYNLFVPDSGDQGEWEQQDDFSPSFAQLLVNPDRYHGKKIRIEGFLHVEFEGNGIYASKDHADRLISREGFWVDFDKQAVPFDGIVGPKEFDRKWVLIEGTFNKNNRGHMGAWSGAIEKIDRVYTLTNYHPDRAPID